MPCWSMICTAVSEGRGVDAAAPTAAGEACGVLCATHGRYFGGVRPAQKIPSGIRSVDDRTWWLEVSTGVGLAIGTVGVVGIVTGPALRARAVEF